MNMDQLQKEIENVTNRNVNYDFMGSMNKATQFEMVEFNGNELRGNAVLTSQCEYQLDSEETANFNDYYDYENPNQIININFNYTEYFEITLHAKVNYLYFHDEKGYMVQLNEVIYNIKPKKADNYHMNSDDIEFLSDQGIDYIDFIDKYVEQNNYNYKEYLNNILPVRLNQSVNKFMEPVYIEKE